MSIADDALPTAIRLLERLITAAQHAEYPQGDPPVCSEAHVFVSDLRDVIRDQKVASNTSLVALLQLPAVKDQFFDKLILHIEESGLTWSERRIIQKVIDRTVVQAMKKCPGCGEEVKDLDKAFVHRCGTLNEPG